MIYELYSICSEVRYAESWSEVYRRESISVSRFRASNIFMLFGLMARNYSNIQYETFDQASEAARRRAQKEGVCKETYAVYPHWDKKGVRTFRISTHEVFVLRWEKNKALRPSCPRARTFATAQRKSFYFSSEARRVGSPVQAMG